MIPTPRTADVIAYIKKHDMGFSATLASAAAEFEREVAALRAENQRLREALANTRDHLSDLVRITGATAAQYSRAIERADAALKGAE